MRKDSAQNSSLNTLHTRPHMGLKKSMLLSLLVDHFTRESPRYLGLFGSKPNGLRFDLFWIRFEPDLKNLSILI